MKQSSIKLGVFTVSMPEFEPLEALEVLAQMGYDGAEWRVVKDGGDKSRPSFWSGNRTSMTAEELIANAANLKKKAKSLGLQMPSIGSYIDSCDLPAVELHMRAAASIGATSLRVSPGKYDPREGPYARQIAKARESYARVADLAKKHKVRSLIETHMGLLTPSVSKARAVLEGLDPKHVGIMWDPGNQVVEGSEVYAMALSIAGEYLAEVHAKNMKHVQKTEVKGQLTWATAACPVYEGIVNWPAVVAELKQTGYKGWIFLEDFSTDLPIRERLQKNATWFKSLLAEENT